MNQPVRKVGGVKLPKNRKIPRCFVVHNQCNWNVTHTVRTQFTTRNERDG